MGWLLGLPLGIFHEPDDWALKGLVLLVEAVQDAGPQNLGRAFFVSLGPGQAVRGLVDAELVAFSHIHDHFAIIVENRRIPLLVSLLGGKGPGVVQNGLAII